MGEECPVCDGGFRHGFQVGGYGIEVCTTCGHQRAELAGRVNAKEHVQRVYDDAYFFGGGAGYPDYTREADLLRDHGRRYARLLARYRPPGALLDVGAAAGYILEGFLDAGWRARGLEPNPRMAATARERLGPIVETGTLEDYRTDERFDVVSLVQVVSHLLDVRGGLEAAARLTRPSGYWLVETWDRRSWTARILGRHWPEYSPPSVVHWFSADGLCRLVGRLGFREVARGRPPKWLSLGHACSLLRGKLGSGPERRAPSWPFGLVPDRLRIPYPGDDVFWALFQAQR